MKKGFTLIELLAVIVILAVIALIATPAVLNIIEDSKKSAAEASARNIVSAAKTHYIKNIMDNKKNTSIDLSTDTLKYDGDKAKKGVLNYDTTGNVSGKIYISGYCVEINNNLITSEKVDEDNCDITQLNPEETKVYTNGEVVYFDVTTGTLCTDYTESQSSVGVKSGCMKFYAFNDDGSDTINLLLDHNTTAIVAWNSIGSNENGPKEVLSQLKTDTLEWKGTLTPANYTIDQLTEVAGVVTGAKYTIDYSTYKARLITANEIAKITNNTTWNEKTNYQNFYFDTNTTTISNTCKNGNISGCKYGWLYDRTGTTCKSYGCLNNSNVLTNGYWTATSKVFGATSGSASGTLYSWAIQYQSNLGYFDPSNVDDDYSVFGVRPVIEVDKSLLK